MIGFYCFDSAPVIAQPTMRQRVVALSAETKTAIYNGFANKVHPGHMRTDISQPEDLIEYIYNGISAIQDRARSYMRGEVLLTPESTTPEGIVTPATYVTSPATAILLRQAIAAEFIDDFPGADINAIVNLMIAQSKYDGKGNFTFYAANIKL